MKSRSKTAAASSKEAVIEPVAPKALPKVDELPRRAFILPNALSKDATIVTLAHPRTLKATRYYHCKKTGFYEIKQFTSGPGVRKSLLLASNESKPENGEEESAQSPDGYIIKTATFFAVTPIDALFLFLPALSPKPKDSKNHKPMFLSLDDHLDTIDESSKHLRHVCDDESTLQIIKRRISIVCDVVEAGDESMYRLNHEKLLKCMIAKAEAIIKAGLPSSMESQFVHKPLEVPMARLLQEEQNKPVPPMVESTAGLDDSQETTGTITPTVTDSSFSESQSTTITVPSPHSLSAGEEPQPSYMATAEIKNLQRLRVALTFLFSSYMPNHLALILEDLISKPSSPLDFTPLTAHLAQLSKLKAEISAQARELMTGDSRKRGLEDEEAALEREDKKRRKEEEERKKRAGESRGVRDLKKVNTAGMKKLSEFFGKKS